MLWTGGATALPLRLSANPTEPGRKCCLRDETQGKKVSSFLLSCHKLGLTAPVLLVQSQELTVFASSSINPSSTFRSGHQGALHVVSHVDGVQLVGQEAVAQVHALLLAAGVDGDDADVRHHDDAHDQVVLLQHRLGHHGNQVQGLLLGALQLHHHHQQVGPGEDRAEDDTQLRLLLPELQQVAAQHTKHTTIVWRAFCINFESLYIYKVHLLCIIYNILGNLDVPLHDALVCADDGSLDVDGMVPHPPQLHGLLQSSHHEQSVVSLCWGRNTVNTDAAGGGGRLRECGRRGN